MRAIQKNALYKHFKGGTYFVEDIAMHTETGELMVIYRSHQDNILYARPHDMFASKVDKEKYPDVEQEYRFELMRDWYTY